MPGLSKSLLVRLRGYKVVVAKFQVPKSNSSPACKLGLYFFHLHAGLQKIGTQICFQLQPNTLFQPKNAPHTRPARAPPAPAPRLIHATDGEPKPLDRTKPPRRRPPEPPRRATPSRCAVPAASQLAVNHDPDDIFTSPSEQPPAQGPSFPLCWTSHACPGLRASMPLSRPSRPCPTPFVLVFLFDKKFRTIN